ncbi:MAG: STAS domain-containing protein [Phycisphaerales bacterium]|nr:STAS domain-containing protein [Phycisphaerales bacterium]
MVDQSPMTVEVTTEGGDTIIKPDGDIDLASSPMLRNKLRESLENASDRVIVDLSAVPYMDSSGVATLVELLQSCRRDSLDLILCQLNERVMSVFQIARLDGVFTIKGSLEDARGA